ncbi:MAG TPA: hypothetical protein VGZ22_14200, partial [Isosphaeraceae bacterium]|nr:hypothetical protein [Isosphaeraceae bacterium]
KVVAGLWIAIGLFVGAYFGAKLTGMMSAVTMKRAYGAFLLIVGAYYLYSTIPSAAPVPPQKPPAAEGLPRT